MMEDDCLWTFWAKIMLFSVNSQSVEAVFSGRKCVKQMSVRER